MPIRSRQTSGLAKASNYNAIARNLGRRDPGRALFVSQEFGIDAAIAALDGNIRAQSVVFTTEIEITGASPTGLIFEIGSSAIGIGLCVAGTDIEWGAGDGTDNALGCGGAATVVSNGRRINIALSINPGAGTGKLIIDGKISSRGATSGGASFGSSLWASNSSGAVGRAAAGTATPRISATGAPSDFAVVEKLRAFYNQLPANYSG